jgi:hypothetical protein
MTADEGVTEQAIDETIVAGLRQQIANLRRQERDLRIQAATMSSQIKRYERALKVLQPGQQPAKPIAKRLRPSSDPTRIGTERMERIREVVLEYAQTHEEFRQVDIRGLIDINSSSAAVAFERMRQENMIRLARREGVAKWYRLTHETLSESEVKDSNGQG